jgi:hypothetical protein
MLRISVSMEIEKVSLGSAQKVWGRRRPETLVTSTRRSSLFSMPLEIRRLGRPAQFSFTNSSQKQTEIGRANRDLTTDGRPGLLEELCPTPRNASILSKAKPMFDSRRSRHVRRWQRDQREAVCSTTCGALNRDWRQSKYQSSIFPRFGRDCQHHRPHATRPWAIIGIQVGYL